MSDEPVKRCPKCRCKVRRLIGAGAGLIFKGSGFYETDYRSDSYKKDKSSETSSSTGSENKSSESKSSDSKAKDVKTATATSKK